ncbi:hypothetical protein GWI24_21700, partial [Streptomyces sp. MK37H]|nr:hypothetical protein [Streptomyces sp. MK37H]
GCLRGRLSTASVLPLYYFTAGDRQCDPAAVLDRIDTGEWADPASLP